MAGAHVDLAQFCDDNAFIADRAADQANRATGRGLDHPPVYYQPTFFAINRRKLIITFHEGIGVNIQGAGHQATDINRRRFAEYYAVGIDQKHPAIGVNGAEYLAGILVHDAV